MKDYEDKAFDELEKSLQRKVAHGVTDGSKVTFDKTFVKCQKHGKHSNVIRSNIKGHEGVWCQICWTEMLGPSLPYEVKKVQLEDV